MATFFPEDHPVLRNLVLDKIFEFYDAPVLFTVRTDLNHAFLAAAVEEDSGETLYLYAAISDDRLLHVRTGAISLRDAFAEAEGDSFFLVSVPTEGATRVDEVPAAWLVAHNHYLPAEGEYLDETLDTLQSFSPERLRESAMRESRHLVGLEIDQPQTLTRTELPLRHSGPIMTEFQELADSFSSESDFALVQLQAASFVFVITPLVGDKMLTAPSPALEKIEQLFTAAAGDGFGAFLADLTPRRKTHVRDFFTVLADAETGISLIAATPEGSVRNSSVPLPRIRAGLGVMRNSTQAESEELHLNGYLIGLNHTRRTFSVHEQSPTGARKKKRRFTGKFDSTVDIEGVASGETVLYKITLWRESAIAEFDEQEVRHSYRLTDLSLLSEQAQA